MKQKTIKAKTYRLLNDRSGQALILKSGRDHKLLVFDEELGYNRAIRHCPNEKSIFIDEQSKHALVQPVVFEFGYLDVKKEDQISQNFLDTHPDNKTNGGKWFEEVDDEKEAKEDIVYDELVTDIKYTIRQKSKEEHGIHALMSVVAVSLGSVEDASRMGIEELKMNLYRIAEDNPDFFTDDEGNIDIFDKGDIYRKYLTLMSIKDGIIVRSNNNKSMLWRKEKSVICTAPASIDIVDFFTDYLTTDDGRLVLEEIEKRR